MNTIRTVAAIIIGLWLIVTLLHMLSWVGAIIGSLFHILLILAIIAFVIDLIANSRNKIR